jgi:hypothetical protein
MLAKGKSGMAMFEALEESYSESSADVFFCYHPPDRRSGWSA